MVPRTKTYLFLALKEWVQKLKPSDLHLTDDFEMEVTHVGSNFLMVRIKDPILGVNYYEVKITEKI